MIFNSLQYALFLPAVVVTFWALPKRARTPFLVAASYVFYAAWDYRFLSLLAVSTLVDFTVGRRIAATDDHRSRLRWLLVSIAVNLSILGSFKYFNFFVDGATDLLEGAGLEPNRPMLDVVLPVGISFYTFQTISYSFDVYRRRIEPTRDLLLFASYVAFFPQLVAGPIERARHLLPQLAADRSRPPTAQVESGLTLILVGLVKKVVIADQVAPYVNDAFADPGRAGTVTLLVGVVGFALQIYGDFSGYTDIARGSARLLSVELSHNFRQPYLARSITDFWRRWHISLSNWLRDYLYVPLGGNRNGRWRTYRNLMITMVLGGLWHGAGWTFVIWGALHGLYLSVHRAFGREDPAPGWRTGFWTVVTFTLVCFAWVFFRAPSLDAAGDVLSGIAALSGPAPDASALWTVLLAGLATLGIDLYQRRWIRRGGPSPHELLNHQPLTVGAGLGVALIAVVVASGGDSVPFIYFQF